MQMKRTAIALSVLLAMSLTTAIVPACAAAGSCGMHCCKHLPKSTTIAKVGDCCRLQQSGEVPPVPVVESSWTSERVTNTAVAAVLLSGPASMLPLDAVGGCFVPSGLASRPTPVPLFILNTSLLI